jgi:hypothetical protein
LFYCLLIESALTRENVNKQPQPRPFLLLFISNHLSLNTVLHPAEQTQHSFLLKISILPPSTGSTLPLSQWILSKHTHHRR